MNNEVLSIKRYSAIFLATVLVLGTFAVISPSFMLGAQAEPYYDRMDDRYDSYEPTYNANEDEEYSSYNNYEYSSNNEYVQEDYSTHNPSSYENEYSENSYDENYYPPKEPKTFICPDSGIVVDYEADCPVVCPAGTALEGHLVLSGSNLEQVCNEEQLDVCGPGTDLEGVFVSNAPGDCNIFDTPPDQPIVTNPEVQCLKCADLVAAYGGGGSIIEFIIGSTDANIFTVCDDADPRPGFNALVPFPLPLVEDQFDRCLDNVAANPGTGTLALQAQALSLQENFLTTNVKPEAGIPTFSAPSVQATGDSSAALEKTTKLKQQWLDLLP